MVTEETRAVLSLNLIAGIGSTHLQRLLSFFGSAQEIMGATHQRLMDVAGLSPGLAERISRERHTIDVDQELDLIAEHNCELLTLQDDTYPEVLRNIYDPPPVLYVRGQLVGEDVSSIAVVGTRYPSRYGMAVTEEFTRELVACGFTIVSGLARGVDGLAHRAAIECHGRTIAVLGNGLSRIYPKEHTDLADQITEYGAVISEFPMRAAPLGQHFPQRNRVISGLSRGILVTEATEKSGSLITARCALEQGREVFAVPGDIHAKTACGPHRLIQHGAALVTNIEEIVEALPAYAVPSRPITDREPEALPELNHEEQAVWNAVGTDSAHIDVITQKVQMPPSQVASVLVMMELKGLIRQLPGKQFARKSLRGF